MRKFTVALAVFSLFLPTEAARAAEPLLRAEDLRVWDEPDSEMMRDYLTRLLDEQFARRDSVLSGLETAADWDRHAARIRSAMAAWTGPFPPRGPLHPRITGRIPRHGYVLEKVLFESRPGLLVSANLYLPEPRSGRCGAVLNAIGHSAAGKATEKVQRRSIAQARKGLVALTIDALGQGERQVPEYAGHGRPPGNAHQLLGIQAFLAGTHVFNLMVWDAIRAVDYLVSRPEVDPNRIACTGCSGGGMMTTYILPFEPRITVAVPACNPNTWSHRVHAGLATDHEQVFFGAFAAGIDPRGDPLFCHVPKPLLINATSDDNLNPPAGVWELSNWLDRAYAAHGAPERLKTVMIQGPHGYNLAQREMAYAWFLRWLDGDASDFREGDFPIEEARDTWCTPQGSVFSSAGSKRPHVWILDHLKTHRPCWPAVTSREELAEHQERLRQAVRSVLALPEPVPIPQVETRPARTIGPLRVTPLVLSPEDGIRLPAVWLERDADASAGPVILYLHQRGKAALAQESLVQHLVVTHGVRLLAVDLRGTGETAPGQEGKFWDFLAGRPLLAQRVADVRSVVRWLASDRAGAEGISVWAHGTAALAAALAAPLDDAVRNLVLEEPLLSFESVVTAAVPGYQTEILLPGVLEHGDLPQVYQACCPKRITLIHPLQGGGTRATKDQITDAYQAVARTYQLVDAGTRWRVATPKDGEARASEILAGLLERSAGGPE